MNKKDEIDASIPEWLAEYTVAIEEMRLTDTELDELLDDHCRLLDAIRYWTGKSEEKVEEFQYLAAEIKKELFVLFNEINECESINRRMKMTSIWPGQAGSKVKSQFIKCISNKDSSCKKKAPIVELVFYPIDMFFLESLFFL